MSGHIFLETSDFTLQQLKAISQECIAIYCSLYKSHFVIL